MSKISEDLRAAANVAVCYASLIAERNHGVDDSGECAALKKFAKDLIQHADTLDAATAVQGGEPVACIVDDGQERELCWWDEGYSGTITKLYAAAPPVQVKGDGYVLELLMAAGHVTPEKVAEAREIASRVAPPAARQDEGRDAARWRYVRDNCVVGIGTRDYSEAEEIQAAVDAAMSREGKDG